jgi:hypothetical protein
VAGEIALASVYTPPNPARATSRATSSAACGGHTETITPARPASPASPPSAAVSPAAPARAALAGLRPSGTHSTVCPAATRHCPTAAPISPGCSNPTVVLSIPPLSPR